MPSVGATESLGSWEHFLQSHREKTKKKLSASFVLGILPYALIFVAPGVACIMVLLLTDTGDRPAWVWAAAALGFVVLAAFGLLAYFADRELQASKADHT